MAGFDERREAFARHLIAAAERGDDDEILLVGHSLGTPLAISVLAVALQIAPDLGRRKPRVALLTLGQTTPMLSLMPEAEWFRQDLRVAGSASAAGVAWLDFLGAAGRRLLRAGRPGTRRRPGYERPTGAPPCPKILNARIMELIDPATYAKVKRDWIRVHFQYLMAGDRLGEYDYFRIVGGPLFLDDRYAGRQSVADYSRLRLFAR